MKRLILAMMVIIMVCILLAVPVMAAAAYTYSITISNSANTTFTSSPWIASVNNTGLVSQDYLSSSGLDAKVMDGSTALPTLVTDDYTLFVDSLGASQSKTVQYTTGNSPAVSMPIIVGHGGHFTTAYNAVLEPGNTNWSLNIAGYLSTSSGADKIICQHGSAILIQVTGDGEITATINDGSPHYIVVDGVPSGHYGSWSLSCSNGTWTMAIGTGIGQATGVGAIPDTSSDWVWNENDVMPYVDSITIGTTINNTPGYQSIASDGTYLYVGYAGGVAQIDPSTMLVTAMWSTGGTIYNNSSSLYYDGTYLYFGTENGQYGEVYKIAVAPNSMTTSGHWTDSQGFGAGGQPVNVIVGDGTYIYAGCALDNGSAGVAKIDTSTMTSSSYFTGTYGNIWAPSGLTYLNGYLYVGDTLVGSTFHIDKVDIDTMTQVASYTGPGGAYSGYWSMAATTDGTDIYFSFNRYITGSGFVDAAHILKLSQSLALINTCNFSGGGLEVAVANAMIYQDGCLYLSADYYSGTTFMAGWITQVDAASMIELNHTAYPDNQGSIIGLTPYNDVFYYIPTFWSPPTDLNTPETTLVQVSLAHMIIAVTNLSPSTNTLLQYQPENIISGTNLPDLAGTQDGVITWGINTTNVSTTLGSFDPTTPTQYGGNGSAYGSSPGSTINLTNPIAPAQLYTELDTSKIPFGTAIDDILNAGGIPRALWWFPFIYLAAIIIGGLVYDATQRTGGQGSILAMAITILVIQTLFGLMGTVGVSGMIPLWSPILFVIPAVALIMSRRHVGWG